MRLRGDQTFDKIDGGYAFVKGKCVVTGELYEVRILEAEYRNATRHPEKLIQDTLPSLPKEEREFLISGISPRGWIVMSYHAIDEHMSALDAMVASLGERGDSASHSLAIVQDLFDKIIIRLKEIEL